MATDWKKWALRLRNRLSPTNSFHVDRRATFKSEANILRTRVDIKGASEVVLEEGVRLRNAELLIRGNANSCIIKKSSHFSGRIELYGDGNTVIIGDGTSIRGALLVAHNGRKIEIGNGCLFSHDVELRTTDSHKIFDAKGARINEDADIVVEHNVWLGHGVAVLKGVAIGEGCIIGTRSIVTKHIPPFSLAVGAPANVIRSNVTWQE
jgi:acetyltransferase-like isoleucine patch superfamily enzyme